MERFHAGNSQYIDEDYTEAVEVTIVLPAMLLLG
jgi:hypothetical protein